MKKIHYLIMSIALSGLFSACQEEDGPMATTNDEIAAIEEQVSLKFDELDIDITGILAEDEGGRIGAFGPNRLRDRCATITRDEVTKTMTIDFGSAGCTGPDGKVRAGKIIVTHTGTFREGNATITHTFENFTVDGAKIEGTRTIEYLGANAQGYLVQKITLSGGKVTFEDQTVVTREANWIRTWVRGTNPILDEFWTEGSASGTTRKGATYTVQINTAIVRKRSCFEQKLPFPVSGTKTIEITETDGGEKSYVVDFGNDDCDQFASVSVNGAAPITFELKYRRK